MPLKLISPVPFHFFNVATVTFKIAHMTHIHDSHFISSRVYCSGEVIVVGFGKRSVEVGWRGVLSHFSCVHLFATLWTAAHEAPLSMGFSREEYGGGLPCLPSGNLPNLGTHICLCLLRCRWTLYPPSHLGSPCEGGERLRVE